MEFTIYRDLASVPFIRCTSAIPGSRFLAEGTAFTVARAIEKCRSECIERTFQHSHPSIESLFQRSHLLSEKMLGIGAHPDSDASAENFWNEVLDVRAGVTDET
jgi:hypothetical protein